MPDLVGSALWLIIAAVAAILVLSAIRARFGRVTIYEYQRGLRYRDGHFDGLVDPGSYRFYRPTTSIRPFDARLAVVTVPGQEVLTTDGVTVKLSLGVQYRVADGNVAFNQVESFIEAMYNTVQIHLRDVVGGLSIDEVLAKRGEIGATVLEHSVVPVRALGVELVALDVKDLMLGPATKKLFAQVVEARQQGLAALEKARGETAALRSLANAAKMVEANPALFQLRLLQQLESTSGNTIVVGLPTGATAVPVRGTSAPEADPGKT